MKSVIDLGVPWACLGVPAPANSGHGARHRHAQLRSENELARPGTPVPVLEIEEARPGQARAGTVRHSSVAYKSDAPALYLTICVLHTTLSRFIIKQTFCRLC